MIMNGDAVVAWKDGGKVREACLYVFGNQAETGTSHLGALLLCLPPSVGHDFSVLKFMCVLCCIHMEGMWTDLRQVAKLSIC
jgi:hypothetical protein